MIKKIIHLSDFHIGCEENNGAVSLKDRFNKSIKYLRTEVENPEDHVIIVTGDIVHNANDNDFQHAKDAFQQLEIDFGYKVLVVPGNHDYRVKKDISGNIKNSKDARIKFCEVFYNGDHGFPKDDIIETTTNDGFPIKIALLGVDSDEDKLEGSKGRIGKKQLLKLDKKLESLKHCNIKVVYLHHNPFYHKIWSPWAMKLIDRVDFIKLLGKHRVSLLLYGHSHTHSFKINKKNVALSIDGGTTTGRGDNDTPARIIDFLTIDYGEIEDFEKEDIETHFKYIIESWR